MPDSVLILLAVVAYLALTRIGLALIGGRR